MSVTSLLAIYGAILSSIGVGWNLYRDLLDRARLLVTATVRRIVTTDYGHWYAVKPDLPVEGASEKLFIIVDVVNVGRRPVKWQGWGGNYIKPVNGKYSFTIVPVGLPKMLNEGESFSEYTPELVEHFKNVKKLFIWDASGKHWNLGRRALRQLKSDVARYSASTAI